jgi:multimeric flavodoxin WrbA
MRLIAIDASPINGGPASYAVDIASTAAEEAGAEVIRIRLYDLAAYACTDCDACEKTGRCTKRDGLLSHASRIVGDADVLILGAPARRTSATHGGLAMLRRLLTAYAGVTTTRGGFVEGASAEGKRAAVIAACPAPLVALVQPGGMARAARKLLAEAGVDLVTCAPVPLRFTHPAARDTVRERAAHLGTRLAGTAAAWPRTAAAVPGEPEERRITRMQRKARRGRGVLGMRASHAR